MLQLSKEKNPWRKFLRGSGPGREQEESKGPNVDETVVILGKLGKTDDVQVLLMLTGRVRKAQRGHDDVDSDNR